MNEELCPICLSNMDDTNNIYRIECGHKFHTECIMKWFRSSKGQCPCCLDNPFTEKHITSNFYVGAWNRLYVTERCSALRKYSKKKESPDKLKDKFNKLKIKENELKELKNQKSTIIKSEEYKDLNKKRQNIDKKLYSKQNTILRMKAKIISDYPTVQTI